MNRRILFAALMLFVNMMMAKSQEPETPRFLFQEGSLKVSGFGGPLAEFSAMDKEFALYNGGGGAVLINQTFFVGGYGIGLSSDHFRDDLGVITGIDHPKLYFHHGGLWLGYIYKHFKPVHAGLNVKIGGGEISLLDEYFPYDPFDDRAAVDKIFVVTPQIEVELSLTAWMKMNVGGGYRFVTGIDKAYQFPGEDEVLYYNRKSFNAPFLSLGFLFGWFNQAN